MTTQEERNLRLRVQSAEIALEAALADIAELHEQLTRANRAAARMARRVVSPRALAAVTTPTPRTYRFPRRIGA